MAQQERQQPIKELRAGTISASVWAKTAVLDGRNVAKHSVRIQKRYRDERTGEWKTTSYFRPEDLPKLVLVASKVFEDLTLREFGEGPATDTQQ